MAKKDKDIFDKIMDWKIFGWLRPFYVKNKEMLLYLFFGVLTTAVSFVTAGISKVLLEQAGIGKGGVSTTSTVISWICAVTFSYIILSKMSLSFFAISVISFCAYEYYEHKEYYNSFTSFFQQYCCNWLKNML